MPGVRLLVLFVACLLTAGCTKVVEGTPSAPSGVLLPPRPREVRLDGVDPCSLLSPAQRAGLGITSEPSYSSSYEGLFHGEVPTCTMHTSGTTSTVLGIGTVTTVGIERWHDPTLRADVWPTTTANFPAGVAIPTQSKTYCSVEVDVAPGQLLDVQVQDGGNESVVPQSDLCERAERSATQMMTSLIAR